MFQVEGIREDRQQESCAREEAVPHQTTSNRIRVRIRTFETDANDLVEIDRLSNGFLLTQRITETGIEILQYARTA